MSIQNDLVAKHFENLLADAEAENVPTDVIGRAVLNQVVALYSQTRSIDDIASELTFLAENLDPDQEYTFMRP